MGRKGADGADGKKHGKGMQRNEWKRREGV